MSKDSATKDTQREQTRKNNAAAEDSKAAATGAASQEEKGEHQYTEEEIKQMSYWQLWGLRRKAGMLYYVLTTTVYAFLIYLFLKVCYIFYTKKFSGFSVDWWAVVICIAIGLIYWYAHELFYRKHNPDADKK